MGRFTGIAATLLVSFCCVRLVFAQDADLRQLREDYARRYLEPEPHMALAKYHHDHGNRLLAYYILEAARRRRFEPKVFQPAFQRLFVDHEPFDNSPQAEQALLQQVAATPDDVETLDKLADIYISRADWKKAKEYLERWLQVAPEQYDAVVVLAEVLKRDDHPQAATKIVAEFMKKYPNSLPAYAQRIDELMQGDPAKAKAVVEEALTKYPDSGQLHFNWGVLLQDQGDLLGATKAFRKAAHLAQDSAYIQGWVARFHLKAINDPEKALEYYLNAYFLDPNFYDSEYAESRIRHLNFAAATNAIAEQKKRNQPVSALLANPNPTVVLLALKEMEANWQPDYEPAFIDLMTHDDDGVRWAATDALMKHTDHSFDPQLRKLLQSEDLRQRGLAAYMAIRRWGPEGVAAIRPWLHEDAQLIRYDAISALALEGGSQGKEALTAYRGQEKNPWLISMLDSIFSEP